jgi:hypothetical protein
MLLPASSPRRRLLGTIPTLLRGSLVNCAGFWRFWFGLILLGSSWIAAYAQTAGDWPLISPADLAMKDNPASPGASAIVLDRDSQEDDIKGVQSEYYRIKIFTDEGRKFANIEIPYFEKLDEVRDVRARTVQPDGTSLEFHGEILDKLIVKSKRMKYQAKIINLPEVEAGSIIEYSYKIAWHQHVPDVLKNPTGYLIDGSYSFPTAHWTLQHDLFTRHARFSVRYLPKGNLQWALVRAPASAVVQRRPDGTAELEVNDVPPLEKEEFVPPDNMLNSRVHFFYVVGYSPPAWFWRDEARRQGEQIDKFIGHSKKIEQATSRLFSPGDPPETKLRKIYARVQQLRYLSYEPAKTGQESKRENLKDNKNVEDVLEHGYAFANEINYLFVAMVRAAGWPAGIVRLTERSRSVLSQNVLDSSQLNATVVLVTLGGQQLFFDPATRFCPYGLLPWAETGVQGLQIGTLGGDFAPIPGRTSETAITRRTATVKVSPEGTVEGTLQVAFTGQEALRRRLELYDEDEAGRRKSLEDEIKQWLAPGATVDLKKAEPWESSEEDLRVECNFTIPDFANVSGHRLLFPLAVFQSNRTNPFKSEKRTYAIYFDYAYQVEDNIKWSFPEGFRPEALPSGRSYQNNFFHYQTTVTATASGLDFHRSTSLNGFIFDAGAYKLIKTAFEQMIGNDNEQAVLQQASPKQ